MLLIVWPSYLKHGLIELCSSFCGHNTSSMVSLSYAPHFVAIIPQTWPHRVMLLDLWPSYIKHGLLDLCSRVMLLVLSPPFLKHGIQELCSSFCGHHTSNMASSSYAPRFVATIPQTWLPRFIVLDLWPSYLKHGLLELCSSF